MHITWPVIFLTLLGCVGCADTPLPVDIVLENVTVIDARSGARSGMDVALESGLIRSVTPHSKAGNIPARQVIDGSDKYLIPGLWDAHVHLAYEEGIDHRVFFPLALAHGVTSLRDTGGHLHRLAAAREAAQIWPAPNLFISGPLIDGADRVYDGSSPSRPDLSLSAATPAAAETIVDGLAAKGVHLVKLYEMLAPDVFRAAAQRASRHGLPVAAHVPLSMTAEQAAEAGADDFQHLRNLEFSCAGNSGALHEERLALLNQSAGAPGMKTRAAIHKTQRGAAVANQDPQACARLIGTLAANDVFQTPTLTIAQLFTHRLYASQRWRDTYELLGPDLAEHWRKRSDALAGFDVQPDMLAFDAWVKSMIPRLRDGNVSLMAGTDAPIGLLTPGASLHEELALLVAAGLTPLEALEAATVTPAAFFGLEHEMGLIAPGMVADLVLLDADPLENIRNAAAIALVFKDGRVIDQAMRRALLTALKGQ